MRRGVISLWTFYLYDLGRQGRAHSCRNWRRLFWPPVLLQGFPDRPPVLRGRFHHDFLGPSRPARRPGRAGRLALPLPVRRRPTVSGRRRAQTTVPLTRMRCWIRSASRRLPAVPVAVEGRGVAEPTGCHATVILGDTLLAARPTARPVETSRMTSSQWRGGLHSAERWHESVIALGLPRVPQRRNT